MTGIVLVIRDGAPAWVPPIVAAATAGLVYLAYSWKGPYAGVGLAAAIGAAALSPYGRLVYK